MPDQQPGFPKAPIKSQKGDWQDAGCWKNGQPINGAGRMSTDLFTRSWSSAALRNHEEASSGHAGGNTTLCSRSWIYGMDYLPEVVQAGNINGFQGFGTDLRMANLRVLEEADIDSMWLGVRWPNRPWTWGLCGQEPWPGFEPMDMLNSTVSIAFASWKVAKPHSFYLSQVCAADAFFYF